MEKSDQHIEEIEPGERLIETVKRHPFGLVKMYFITLIGLLALIVLFYLMLSERIKIDPAIYNVFIVVTILVALLVLLILFALTAIYYQTKLVITDENLIIVQQKGFFSRSASSIFLADIEDVTSAKHGIAPSIFGYGILRIETESEQRNFILNYCPEVERVSKAVLDAKENYIAKQGNANSKSLSD
jgi:uncharacterized membrane protein YdbT with pleckstrin-like domain